LLRYDSSEDIHHSDLCRSRWQNMNLIRTAAKERLPKGFSYPLGAQSISAALEGVPGMSDSSLWFCCRDEYWASSWRHKIVTLGDVRLLEIADSYDGHGRDVWAYAVPCDFSMAARERLASELPKVREILLAGGASRGTARVFVTISLALSANNKRRTAAERSRASRYTSRSP